MNGVGRLLGRREKRDRSTHNPSKDAYRVFWGDRDRKPSRDEEKNIHDILKRLEELDIHRMQDINVKYALHHPYAQGDPDKALELLRLLHQTVCGKLIKFNPVIPMVGAENRNMVTCWIDSLLFSMFARVDSFESMLSVKFSDTPTNNLANLIRLWVNMLRTGKLITTDMVKLLQDALAECGWEEAGLICQQDVSEAFAFITDKLALPLLTLKMDVYHTGKESSDDHRLVRERLLDVAIPEEPSPDGLPIRLEDCLENFLNNKVEVRRMLQRRNTINSRPSEVLLQEEAPSTSKAEHKDPPESPLFRKFMIKQPPKVLSGGARVYKDDMEVSYGSKTAEGESVLRKEVLLPAWQFYHLIPWFQSKPTNDGQMTTDEQIAAHFAKRRPILGICLKRYKQTAQGPKRVDTLIDIPLEMRLPHFIADGSQDDGFGSSFSTFKLSLQSIVCHRGLSLNGGHYISIVRPSPHEMSTGSSEHDNKYSWIRHDDLARDERISIVDVRKALKEECPYLLFYQVQLINDDEEYNYTMRSSSEFEDLPTYAEATTEAKDDPPPSKDADAQTSDPVAGSVNPQMISAIDHAQIVAPNAAGSAEQTQESGSATTAEGHITFLDIPTDEEAALKRSQSSSLAEISRSLRGHSLDIPSSGRASVAGNSQKSRDSTSQRSSINLTDGSNFTSLMPTPYDEKVTGADSALNTDIPDGDRIKGSASPGKMFNLRRGRQRDKLEDAEKDKEADKGEKRPSRYWLSAANKESRPKSVPPNDGRSSVSVADLMKSFKIGSSKDKLPITTVVGPDGDVISPETSGESNSKTASANQSPKLAGTDVDTPTKSMKEGMEKLTGLGIGRRKSQRNKKEARRLSLGVINLEDMKDDPDRQCLTM